MIKISSITPATLLSFSLAYVTDFSFFLLLLLKFSSSSSFLLLLPLLLLLLSQSLSVSLSVSVSLSLSLCLSLLRCILGCRNYLYSCLTYWVLPRNKIQNFISFQPPLPPPPPLFSSSFLLSALACEETCTKMHSIEGRLVGKLDETRRLVTGRNT